jgi:N6-adenosine-specific RNA methylase IME4
MVDQGQRYACIYADPPWSFRNRSTRAAAEKHYGTLSLATIKALPVRRLALARAHLHLWVPNTLLPQGLDVLHAWGFEYKGYYGWGKERMGLGNYWRNASELMLLGVRGNLPPQTHDLRNWGIWKRGEHSRKPDQIRRLVEKFSPGPYLELFGRDAIDGWTVWGNDIAHTLWHQEEG